MDRNENMFFKKVQSGAILFCLPLFTEPENSIGKFNILNP